MGCYDVLKGYSTLENNLGVSYRNKHELCLMVYVDC